MAGDAVDAIDELLADLELCACGCGRRLRPGGASPWFAGQDCQRRYGDAHHVTDPAAVYDRPDPDLELMLDALGEAPGGESGAFASGDGWVDLGWVEDSGEVDPSYRVVGHSFVADGPAPAVEVDLDRWEFMMGGAIRDGARDALSRWASETPRLASYPPPVVAAPEYADADVVSARLTIETRGGERWDIDIPAGNHIRVTNEINADDTVTAFDDPPRLSMVRCNLTLVVTARGAHPLVTYTRR